MTTPGMIQMQVTCSACGQIINTEADPLAGQEWIDKLSALVRCNSCADYRTRRAQPKEQAEVRKPHND